MEGIRISLCHPRSKDAQLILGKRIVELERASPIGLVLSGSSFPDVRLVNRVVQLVCYAEFSGQLEQGFVELILPHPLVVHIDADGILSAAFASEVRYLPDTAIFLRIILSNARGRGSLVTNREVLFRINTILRLRVTVQDDVQSTVRRVENVFSFNHDLFLMQK